MAKNSFDNARRNMLTQGAAALAMALLGTRARAQAWPAKPVRLVLGYTPGGAADVTAREIAAALGKLLGQSLVVDYKPGASGTIAAAEVARAAPDGYTLGLLDNAPLTIVPAMRSTGYDPLTGFTQIALISQLPQVLVAPSSAGINTARELIDAMRRQPGKLNHASGGAGSVGHLAAELFKQRTGTFAVHVPYRGGAPAITSLLAGDAQFAFLTASATAPLIASGKLKALGVSSRARLPSLPNVPTIAEAAVPDFEVPGWFALAGPPGLPESVVTPLRKAVAEMLTTPAMTARLEALGQNAAPARFDVAAAIATEHSTWKKLFSERKIVIDN